MGSRSATLRDVRGRGCIICSHDRRAAIEGACAEPHAAPFAIAEEFAVTRAALRKHDSHPRAASTPDSDTNASASDARRRAPILSSEIEERTPETVRSARFDYGARLGMSRVSVVNATRAALDQPSARTIAIVEAVDRLVRLVLGSDVEAVLNPAPLKQSGGS